MDLIAGVSLLVVMLTLAAMPSGSVALVVTRSATLGFANGVAVALGIVLGDLVFVVLAIFGMSFLAETMGSFFVVLKFCGGAYLIWFGFSLFLIKPHVDLRSSGSRRISLISSCGAGLVLTLGDVKAIFFYASLFPAFVDMTSLTTRGIIMVVLVTIVAVGGVKVLYALTSGTIVKRFQNRKAQKFVRTTAGCLMVSAGSYLIAKA